jgi:hypothetical protein
MGGYVHPGERRVLTSTLPSSSPSSPSSSAGGGAARRQQQPAHGRRNGAETAPRRRSPALRRDGRAEAQETSKYLLVARADLGIVRPASTNRRHLHRRAWSRASLFVGGGRGRAFMPGSVSTILRLTVVGAHRDRAAVVNPR